MAPQIDCAVRELEHAQSRDLPSFEYCLYDDVVRTLLRYRQITRRVGSTVPLRGEKGGNGEVVDDDGVL